MKYIDRDVKLSSCSLHCTVLSIVRYNPYVDFNANTVNTGRTNYPLKEKAASTPLNIIIHFPLQL